MTNFFRRLTKQGTVATVSRTQAERRNAIHPAADALFENGPPLFIVRWPKLA